VGRCGMTFHSRQGARRVAVVVEPAGLEQAVDSVTMWLGFAVPTRVDLWRRMCRVVDRNCRRFAEWCAE